MFPGSLALIFKKDSNILMSKVLPKRLGLVKSKTVVPSIKDLSSMLHLQRIQSLSMESYLRSNGS